MLNVSFRGCACADTDTRSLIHLDRHLPIHAYTPLHQRGLSATAHSQGTALRGTRSMKVTQMVRYFFLDLFSFSNHGQDFGLRTFRPRLLEGGGGLVLRHCDHLQGSGQLLRARCCMAARTTLYGCGLGVVWLRIWCCTAADLVS